MEIVANVVSMLSTLHVFRSPPDSHEGEYVTDSISQMRKLRHRKIKDLDAGGHSWYVDLNSGSVALVPFLPPNQVAALPPINLSRKHSGVSWYFLLLQEFKKLIQINFTKPFRTIISLWERMASQMCPN